MHLPAVLGAWGMPPDGPAWAAFAVAVAAVGTALAPDAIARHLWSGATGRFFLMASAFGAALLSLGYVAFYLRGGPRIIDATSYFLQARGLSEGHLAWHVPEPTASFRGRFLLFHDGEVAGIFPPGYPLLLSLGFAAGAPLVVGPALAGAIVVATWALARELACEAGLDRRGQDSVARVSACLSVACAALRYHTADTMTHGACALAFALAILSALHARREGLPWFFLFTGLALGFVVATRFASAVALGSVVAWLALGARSPGPGSGADSTRSAAPSAILACLIGSLPGILLLLVSQSVGTGHALGSTQSAYYAASDGPPGCFRYGFGAGIGCLVEHGDFVRARTGDGYGLVAALGVTFHRLRMHSEDVASFEPLALLVFVPLVRSRSRTLGVRACTALIAALVLAYAPFYYDGDYPAGGARFFADAIPIEHALIAVGLATLADSSARSSAPTGVSLRAAAAVLALSALGFAVHSAYDHEQLRGRDGGFPMFDPEVLAARSLGPPGEGASPSGMVRSAREPGPSLVFVETDHGFDLAHDPDATDRAALALRRGEKPSGTIVARLRGDDYDRLLYERLGRPPAWVYRFIPDSPKTLARVRSGHAVSAGGLEPWPAPPPWSRGGEAWRFEAENEWPPLAQTGAAWGEPIWASDTCASPSGSGRALALHATGPEGGSIILALPIPRAGAWRATPRLLADKGAQGVALEVLAPDGAVLARWGTSDTTGPSSGAGRICFDGAPRVFSVPTDRELRLSVTPPNDAAHRVALDRVLVEPAPPSPR